MGEQTIVIGAGPAGLAAARELALADAPVTVLERDTMVGGLSRTVEHRGFRFDIGGHRFFTKIDEIQRTWEEIMGEDFLACRRLSRIFFRGQLMDYPLRIGSTLRVLGLKDAVLAMLSYFAAQLRPQPEDSFEGWVSNRFGRRLYRHFFETYTEKVWGMPCTELSADWAAQRIKGLSLWGAVRDALLNRGADEATTLLRRFNYPRLGPGQLFGRYRDQVVEGGGEVLRQRDVVGIRRDGTRITHVIASESGSEESHEADQFVSSMPLADLVGRISPAPPDQVGEAAKGLRQRGFLTVALIVAEPDPFPDQWIYVHEPTVKLGRVQNYRNWSPQMVPDEDCCCIGVEYFAWEGDALWQTPDEELVDLASREVGELGLIDPGAVVEGVVVRMADAYPVYDPGYTERVHVIREWLATLENLQTIGRAGMHRYNNMDHSVMTGMLAARNILGEEHDVWSVNTEEEYLEKK